MASSACPSTPRTIRPSASPADGLRVRSPLPAGCRHRSCPKAEQDPHNPDAHFVLAVQWHPEAQLRHLRRLTRHLPSASSPKPPPGSPAPSTPQSPLPAPAKPYLSFELLVIPSLLFVPFRLNVCHSVAKRRNLLFAPHWRRRPGCPIYAVSSYGLGMNPTSQPSLLSASQGV